MIGICHVPVASLYNSPSFKAEIVSQLLAGELVEVLDVEQTWFYIINLNDGFKGWVDRKMIEELIESQENSIAKSFTGMVKAPLLCSKDQYGRTFYLPGGAKLYSHGSSIAVAPCRNLEMDVKEHLFKPVYKSRKELIETALAYNGAPFLWGGKTIFGIDCSGLLQIVFELNGIRIPRKLDQQIEMGSVVSFSAESKPGDLAFFENAEGAIIHAGIIMDSERIIHAYGEVRVDMLDHEGIFNKYTRQYSHKLRVIKNIVGD